MKYNRLMNLTECTRPETLLKKHSNFGILIEYKRRHFTL